MSAKNEHRKSKQAPATREPSGGGRGREVCVPGVLLGGTGGGPGRPGYTRPGRGAVGGCSGTDGKVVY